MQEGMAPWAALMAMGFAAVMAVVLVAVAIGVAICWFLMTCFERVPTPYRKQQPGLVWLLMIPCFNLIWSFFVYPRLADSYKAYFDSVGRADVGDCGRSLALWCCILPLVQMGLSTIGSIPALARTVGVVNCLVGLASLVVFILFLVKAASLKSQIPQQAA